MNYNQSIYWELRFPPSPNTVMSLEQQQVNLQEVVPPFVITLPLCLHDSVTRIFPGGTFLSLLQMIHDFYQEPVTYEDLRRIMNLPSFNRNRMATLAERHEAGVIVKRIDILSPWATYEEIRESELLVDVW